MKSISANSCIFNIIPLDYVIVTYFKLARSSTFLSRFVKFSYCKLCQLLTIAFQVKVSRNYIGSKLEANSCVYLKIRNK